MEDNTSCRFCVYIHWYANAAERKANTLTWLKTSPCNDTFSKAGRVWARRTCAPSMAGSVRLRKLGWAICIHAWHAQPYRERQAIRRIEKGLETDRQTGRQAGRQAANRQVDGARQQKARRDKHCGSTWSSSKKAMRSVTFGVVPRG